jgi:hypothetical protein
MALQCKMELTQKNQHSCFNCGYECSTHYVDEVKLHINSHDVVVLHNLFMCEKDWQHYQKCKDVDESRMALGFLLSSKMVVLNCADQEQVNAYKHRYLCDITVMH